MDHNCFWCGTSCRCRNCRNCALLIGNTPQLLQRDPNLASCATPVSWFSMFLNCMLLRRVLNFWLISIKFRPIYSLQLHVITKRAKFLVELGSISSNYMWVRNVLSPLLCRYGATGWNLDPSVAFVVRLRQLWRFCGNCGALATICNASKTIVVHARKSWPTTSSS